MRKKVLGLAVCIIVMSLFCVTEGFQTSSESVNPFNQFMTPSGGVNLYSGDVAYSFPICAIGNINVTLNYSSNIYLNVRSRNDIAPTSWVGLGWSLNFGSISCNHKGTKSTDDDEFYLISPLGVGSKILHSNKVNYKYYEGTWSALPNFTMLTPKYSGQANNFDINKRLRDNDFAIVFESYITIATAGQYTFYTNSDDGSKLYIDDGIIVSNDGVHNMQEGFGTISNLAAGLHSIRVEYFQNGSTAFGLEVRYSGPGIAKTLIPDNILDVHGPNDIRKDFYIENDPYSIITPQFATNGTISGWIVRSMDGGTVKYGLSDAQKATRYTLCVGNTVGQVSSGTPTLYPYQWDISSIEDQTGNYIKYYYWQPTPEQIKCGLWNSGSIGYTKESYIERIETRQGVHVIFEREPKTNESYDPYTFENEPDGYIEIYGSYRLKRVKVYPTQNATEDTRLFELDYSSINAETGQLGNRYRKSLLTSIKECQGNSAHQLKETHFEYYTDYTSTDLNYNYGAIKSISTSQGGKTEYSYKRQELAYTRINTFGKVDTHKDLFFGSLRDGNGYCVVLFGEHTDEIAVYNWDGGNWRKVTEMAPAGYNYSLDVRTGNGYFAVIGGENKDKLWVYEWDGNFWQPCITADAPGGYGANHNLDVSIGDNHIGVACGTNKDKVCVYTKVGTTWRRTLDYVTTDPPWGYGYPATLSFGTNALSVVCGSNRDKLFLYRWNGNSWSSYEYFEPDGTNGKNKNLTAAHCENTCVITGGENTDLIWVYRWNAQSWSLTNTFNPAGNTNENKNLIAVPGENYIAITGGVHRDQVWISTWNGSAWSDPVYSPCEGTGNFNKGFTPSPGNNFFVVYGGINADKLFIYNWNGSSWDAPISYCPYDCGNDSKHIKAYVGQNFCVTEGGEHTDIIWVFTWDGQQWHDKQFSQIGSLGERKYLRAGPMQFGVRCGEGGDNLYFFQKFQDNFDTPIFSYVVDTKTLSNGLGKNVITNFDFTQATGNYDTRAGTAKYNKVSTIIPNNGRTVSYFFNDVDGAATDQDKVNPKFRDLDGMVYRTEMFKQSNTATPISKALNTIEYYVDPLWPPPINQKRTTRNTSISQNVTSVNDILEYNHINGLPKINRMSNSDGKQKFTKSLFAFEQPAYSTAMGVSGTYMLTQPCQTIVYEKAVGDNTPLCAADVRSSQVTTWSPYRGCAAWVPDYAYSWNSDKCAYTDFVFPAAHNPPTDPSLL